MSLQWVMLRLFLVHTAELSQTIGDKKAFSAPLLWPLLCSDVAQTEKRLTCEKPDSNSAAKLTTYVALEATLCALLPPLPPINSQSCREMSIFFFFRSISCFSSTAAEMNLLGEMRNTHSSEGKKNNKNLKRSFSFTCYLKGCLPSLFLSFPGSFNLLWFSHSHSQTALLPTSHCIWCFFFYFCQIVTM